MEQVSLQTVISPANLADKVLACSVKIKRHIMMITLCKQSSLLTSLILCSALFSLIDVSQAKEVHFCSPQILAHPIKGGYTWTVASRLGKFLEIAENEYGERDKRWTILGVEFTDEAQPSIWYPLDAKEKDIIIQLTRSAANDEKKMLFQLAHEVFHVLSPAGKRNATFLEEGLATYFSIKATQQIGMDISPSYIASRKYRQAYDLIEQVYLQYPDVGHRIATFRKLGTPLSGLTEAHIKKLFPGIDASVASKLAEHF